MKYSAETSFKMSMIKKFFEKKKTDAKFKLAGKGQKLCDPQAPTPGPSVQPRPGPSGAQRGLTNEQRLAAEAALSRFVTTIYLLCLCVSLELN